MRHSFAVFVAPFLLSMLAFKFLKKKKSGVHRNAKDADSASSSSITPTETNFHASSSSTAPTGNHFDVFLSFRGLDTRKCFADHLYHGLMNAGIRAFRVDNEFCQGEKINPDLMVAIRDSKILIPILSVNYGSSKWCLNELVQIMECKNNNMEYTVLPMFYKVEPIHVRHQIGSFGDKFRFLERCTDPTILKKWKEALHEVSFLKGWEFEGYGGELVKLIVQKVLIQLKKQFQLAIPEILVGIDGHMKKIMKFVDDNSHATLFVGIHGMGGIGKTTLAKTIYNKLSDQFNSRSFIADIRESCKRNGLEYLQNQLISDLLKQQNRILDKDEGPKFISSMFQGEKVLILLDDVDDDDQLKVLVGHHNWFSSGSRIIITTRNLSILENSMVDYSYEHKEMDMNQSLILFSKHAFRRDYPSCEFDNLTYDMVSTIGGLPLLLEVLGSFLYGQDLTHWRGTINKLRKVPHRKVREKLRISYEALDYRQQQVFLDIACFFIGTSERIASYMWDACGFCPEEAIEVLRYMSLIKVGDNHELIMHDQLRDLGREIIREENQLEPQWRSRLWDSMEVMKVLNGNEGTNKIEAIYLNKGSSEGFNETTDQGGHVHTNEQFKNLTSLRFLHVSEAHFLGDFKNSTNELRWLRWQISHTQFEANNFHLKELVVLDLSRSEISDKWLGWSFIMMANKLKFLNLTSCQSLRSTFFLSAFKKLEVLILRYCWRLEQIDASIGDMKSLVQLDLTGCRMLKELPTEVGKLQSLKQLLLKDSLNFSLVPDSIDALQTLEILNISDTVIKKLPNAIGRLRKLRDLDASRCKELGGEIPESFNNLSSLQCLNFGGCTKLQSLPELPSNLKYLNVTCQSRKLPSFSHQNTPFKLEILEIHGCKFVETLDVSQLNHLKTLSVKRCDNIHEVRDLDKLKCLESLTIAWCASIERLDLPRSKILKKLVAGYCTNLVKIQGLDRLEFLEKLDISESASIERLHLSKSKGLKFLIARYCENLLEIQGLDRLELLEMLDISWCASIEKIDLPKSDGLKILNAQKCKKLGEIQGLHGLDFLEKLDISWCTSIKRLDLSKSKALKKLYAAHCENLVEIQGLDRLEFLEEVHISGNALIKRLDIPESEVLKILDVENCKNLVEIQDLNRLKFVEVLNITGCASIERLDLRKFKGMKKLDVQNCENLVEIQGLDRLEFLKVLNISGCTLIEKLDLPKFKGLKILDTRDCKNLVEIQGLDRMEFLESLDITGCTSMKRLKLPKLQRLKILGVGNCENLVEIEGINELVFLNKLNISGCTSIKSLDLSKSEGLKILDAENCENLVEIQGINRFESLEVLNISGCISIEKVDLPKSESMKKLYVGNCENLIEIQGLERLEFLEVLNISGCTSIKRLNLLKSKGMKILDAQYCKNLVEIQGLERLEFLEVLNVSGCTSIERLNLPKSMGMKIFDA